MKINVGSLRRIIRIVLEEEAWVPGRWMPDSGEPVDDEDLDAMSDDYESISEVDLDPANNPGRPADPYDYLGMHPAPTAAMAHPYAAGGGGAAPGSYPASTNGSGGWGASAPDDGAEPDEATE